MDSPSAPPEKKRPRWLAPAVVVVSMLAATVLRELLDPVLLNEVPYVLFLAAVAASTRWGGWRAGAVSTVLSTVLGSYLYTHPRRSLLLAHTADRVAAVVFVVAAGVVVMAIHGEQRARRAVLERDARLLKEAAERQRLEASLVEAQRLESIGRLAGGVAHDFNNLLTVVLGSVQLLHARKEDVSLVEGIELAARRGADLNKQLLGFARRQMMQVGPLVLTDVVEEGRKLAERLLPEDIQLRVVAGADPWTFKGDRTQVQQVLLNLLTNARDALPEGGTIVVETENTTLDEAFARQIPEVTPGEYVHLSVSDDGAGMSDELRLRVFEPFFTTKEVGKGTGLGLAVTYGIVKQLDGHIFVRSQPQKGTRFDVYWPRAKVPMLGGPVSERPREPTRRLHILCVEDDPLVRATTQRMLESLGHEVTAASDGAEALRIAGRDGTPIDVLVTDVVMPWMNGRELAERLRETRPDLKVVFVSGYTENVVLQKGIVKPGVLLLKKPFSVKELEAALAEADRLRASA